jgi:hypothetical protein
MSRTLWLVLAVGMLALPSCSKSGEAPATSNAVTNKVESKIDAKVTHIKMVSAAFEPNGAMPDKYGCKGQGVSPPLRWDPAPKGAKSWVLICEDPDAPSGTFTHWVMYNIPASVFLLPENVKPQPSLPDGSSQGINDYKKIGYGAPCPPSGTHHYHFKIYALDTKLDLPAEATKDKVVQAMQNHTLATGELVGTYSK